MSEYKFSCPQCGQKIQCGTGYAGTQIYCPGCQQAIVVSPAPASAVPPQAAPSSAIRRGTPVLAAAQPPVRARSHTLRKILVIAAAVLVLAGLIIAVCFKSSMQIISAVYGSGANFADVSRQVGDLVHQRSEFNAQPRYLKADPSPGWNKTLVIVYEVRGQRHIFTTGEGGKVSAAILLKAAVQ
ncbi:MAG TPA: hypothetical protein VIK35_00890 [Verrucomicrobiae bacterium]